MKYVKTSSLLGIAGAVLLPMAAVAALDIPHMFAAGDPVSASEMNENFAAIKAKVEELEAGMCTGKGGYWTGTACESFMQPSATMVTGEEANKFNQCAALDTANSIYVPCNAFHTALAHQAELTRNSYYWLQSGGQSGQGGVGTVARTGPSSITVNPPQCAAATSLAFFHHWNTGPHTDGIACVANTTPLSVACCRQPPAP